MRILLTIIGVLGVLAVAGHALWAGGSARLYVVNALSETLSVIELGTDELAGQIALGERGYDIALLPGGNQALVTIVPDPLKTQDELVSPHLALVDLDKRQVSRQIGPLPLSPLASVHVHPTGKQAFVVTAAPPGERNDRRGQLLVVDLATGKVGKSVPLGLNPLDSAMTPDGARLFTADWGSRALSVVDLTTGRLQDSLPLGQYAARTLAMRADGKTAYAVLERAVVATTMNSAPSTYQNMAQTNIAPAEEATLLAEIAVASHKLTRHPLPGLSPVCALTPSPDGRLLYIYGRRTPAGSVGRQPAGDGYVLLCYDLKTHAVVRSLGDFGFLTRIVVSPNGEKLYLIGTPGDPAREAIVQQNYVKRSQGTPNMAGPAGPSGSAPANTPSASARQSPQITETLEDLRRLEKTVTILDAHSGRRLKTLTVGSLPQGAAVRK